MKKWFVLVFFILVSPQIQSQQIPEGQMVDLINAERAKAGVASLFWNETLAQVATAHAQDMVVKGYFSHISKERSTPFRRVQNSGYYSNYRGFMFVAENIEMHSGGADVILAHSRLMNSLGHRKNILSKYVNEVGIGFAVGQFTFMGRTYTYVVCVQVFAYHPR